MAYYAALASLTNLLHDIISENRYPNYLLSQRSSIHSLHQTFNFLEESLHDYSSKGDEASDHVEARIRDLAQRVMDIVEIGISNQCYIDLGESIIPCDPVLCRHDLDLAEVKHEVDSIVEVLTAMKESHGDVYLQPEDDYSSNVGSSSDQTPAGLNITVGLDEYLTKIKDQLCRSSSQLQVISIVGMGGIGKTTLARKAFDDSLVSYHFYRRAWTSISQEYNAERVLLSIQESIRSMLGDLRGDAGDRLEERIYKSLKGQKYLIVIDDVWDTEVLSDIMRIFPNDSNGSRILLTTRLQDVAGYATTSYFTHEMQILNAEDSWNLLREKLFAQEHCPAELEGIGKFIASKCGGLPLAIVAIAGILLDRRAPEYWKKVASNVASILNRDGEQLSNILSLSFHHLSHQLKACFLFMGCLSVNHFYGTFRLAAFWFAEGFLKSSNGSKTLEQVAEECLVDLVKRNLVIENESWTGVRFKLYAMHDLVREFCRKRGFKERFFHGKNWESHIHEHDEVKRIISNSCGCEFPEAFGTTLKQSCACNKYSLLRSIVWDQDESRVIDLNRFKLLRLMDISKLISVHMTVAFSHMFFLKCLYLPSQVVNRQHGDCLLNSVFKIPNLETLAIIGKLDRTISLPSDFWRMSRLRFLIIDTIKLPPIIKDSHGVAQNLKCLRELGVVMNFTFTNEAIEMIFNLRRLFISCQGEDNNITDLWKKHALNNLANLRQLGVLRITFRHHMPSAAHKHIVLPLNLNMLMLDGCRLSWKELTGVGSLPCLQVLHLYNDAVVGEEWESIEGEFLQLKTLYLNDLDLQYWRADHTHFPCLKELRLIHCNMLKEIPPEIGDIPTLESITVHYCRLAGDSAKRILEEQRSQGNDALRVHVLESSKL